jgi:predicted PurR-regulated permease PerM
MGIQNKIEEIRKKPEHIRLRYVWAMVAISMFFIIIIWFFSLKASQTQTAPVTSGIDTSAITDQLNQGKESIQSAGEGFQNALNNSANQQ